MAVSISAALADRLEISLGDALGSNIFNCLLIVGITAVIQPIAVAGREVAGVLSFGVIAVALTLPNRRGINPRFRGAPLLALYAVYLIALLRR